MIDNDKISNTQLWIFLTMSMIGIGIFSLPRAVAEVTDTDGWVTTILGGLVSLFGYYIMSRLAKKFPGDTFVEMTNKILGKFIGAVVILIFGIYLLTSIAGMLRIFGEVTKMSLLARTPVEIILLTILIVVFWLSRCGIEAIVRFDESVLILSFIVLILMFALTLPQVEFSNILPFMHTPIKKIILGTYETTYSFAGFELILLIVPFIKSPGRIFKSGTTAFIIVIATYTLAVVISFGYFGVKEVKELIWPTMAVIKSVEVPGSFVERLEGIVMTLWIIFSFTSLIAYTYGVSLLTSRAVGHKEFKHFCPIFIPVVYLIAMWPDNVVTVYKMLDRTILYFGAPSLFIFPLLLLIASSIRKVGEKNG